MAKGGLPPRDQSAEETALGATYRKVTLRLLPFLGLCYVAAYLDRVNIGFAKLQMASELSLSDTAYGLGAGIFFIGYFIFEVPSNLILHRIGAKVWLSRIMITWGVVSASLAALAPIHAMYGDHGAELAFYALRFLLGVAEAGFFPGVLLYLTYWFPPSRQSFALALFILAQPVSFIFGGPISGLILDAFNGVAGFAGWQWMYVLEAAPAVLLGVWLLFRLDNGIADAKWLSADEKTSLTRALEAEASPNRTVHLGELARSGRIWLFALVYFLLMMGTYGINFWLPSIVKNTGVTGNLSIGLLTAAPYLVAVVVMLSVSARTPDPAKARVRAAWMSVLAGIGLAISAASTDSIAMMMVGVTIGVMGYLTAIVLFWCVPSQALAGAAVAAGLAAINAVGNVGGFAGPYLIGALSDRYGSTSAGLFVLAGCLAAAGAVLALMGDGKTLPEALPQNAPMKS